MLTGAGAVVALVMLEWSVGWLGAAAWIQSWRVVKRGHFRILGWGGVALALAAAAAYRSAAPAGAAADLAAVVLACALLYAAAQYVRSDAAGAVAGAAGAAAGVAALALTPAALGGWPAVAAAANLISGAALLGAVTNGMLLGHWYLNQPGLAPWALARLTGLALAAAAATGAAGLASARRLASADTEGAVLGLPGFGESFGPVFYVVWLGTLVFTGVVAWMARRCVKLRSIQSATGLYYVALLTAGVSEFVARYLMVGAA